MNKPNQDQLSNQTKFYYDLVEASNEFIGSADFKTQKIIYCNPAGRKMLNIPSELNISDFTISQFQSEKSYQKIGKETIPALIKQGSWKGELTLIPFDTKKEIPIFANLSSQKNKQGELVP
jgi:hypothetical protein